MALQDWYRARSAGTRSCATLLSERCSEMLHSAFVPSTIVLDRWINCRSFFGEAISATSFACSWSFGSLVAALRAPPRPAPQRNASLLGVSPLSAIRHYTVFQPTPSRFTSPLQHFFIFQWYIGMAARYSRSMHLGNMSRRAGVVLVLLLALFQISTGVNYALQAFLPLSGSSGTQYQQWASSMKYSAARASALLGTDTISLDVYDYTSVPILASMTFNSISNSSVIAVLGDETVAGVFSPYAAISSVRSQVLLALRLLFFCSLSNSCTLCFHLGSICLRADGGPRMCIICHSNSKLPLITLFDSGDRSGLTSYSLHSSYFGVNAFKALCAHYGWSEVAIVYTMESVGTVCAFSFPSLIIPHPMSRPPHLCMPLTLPNPAPCSVMCSSTQGETSWWRKMA